MELTFKGIKYYCTELLKKEFLIRSNYLPCSGEDVALYELVLAAIVVFETNCNLSAVEVNPGEISGMFVDCWYLELVETFLVLADVLSTKWEESGCDDDVWGCLGK